MSTSPVNKPSGFPTELINLLRQSNEVLIALSVIEATLSRRQIDITEAEISLIEKRVGIEQAADPERQIELIAKMEAKLSDMIKDANETSEILDRLNAPAMKVRNKVMEMTELAKEDCAGCEGGEEKLQEQFRTEDRKDEVRKTLKALRTLSKRFEDGLNRLITAQPSELSSSSDDEPASSESEEEF